MVPGPKIRRPRLRTPELRTFELLLYLRHRFMKPVTDIFPLLDQPRQVVITTHQKPDPDAMGSSLGLAHFLRSFGHRVTVISPTNWAAFLNWMPGSQDVTTDRRPKDASNRVPSRDLGVTGDQICALGRELVDLAYERAVVR